MIADDLALVLQSALTTAGLPVPPNPIEVVPTKHRDHGDWQSNIALVLAKAVGESPREVASRIAAALEAASVAHVDRIEIAGPGFLNFFLAPSWVHNVLADVIAAGEAFGRGTTYAGLKVNLEFVSANPTGPIHAGGGRWVAVGDAIANLLAAQGADVHREYYLNDAGNQLDVFSASLMARYCGDEPPENGYQGEYVVDLADRMRAELGDTVTESDAAVWGYEAVVAALRDDLARIGVHFDTWFSERTLHARGDVTEVLDALRAAGHTYLEDDAEWLASEALGDQRDRVLVRSNGTTTYLTNDLAYHRDKLARGWEHLIDIWGADHHGQVKSLQVGLRALGVGTETDPEPEIILGQLVKLERGGVTVRLSKRAGTVITLADILDEVDPDVARLTFLLQSIDTSLTFDLDVVTAQSMENPVYYVQYAHARCASIARRAADAGIARIPFADVDRSLLVHERELDLLRALAEYPDMLRHAAELRAPHRVTTWVRDFASRFHGFYRDCRVITDDPTLTQARLWLAEAARLGLANALTVLGVSAPDVMERLDEPDPDER
ncbi:MAG: arginine--tRNA ligase, partial [Acidimicrobiia bacterium]